MDRPAEQREFDTAPPEREESAAPRVTFSFTPTALYVLREGAQPERWPIRSNERQKTLLRALLTADDEPRNLESPDGAWVGREVLLLVVDPESADPNASLKKTKKSLSLWLEARGLGAIQVSGTGLWRYVAPPGTKIAVRLRR